MDESNWKSMVRKQLKHEWQVSTDFIEDSVRFFERAFANTRCYNHAWFGIHANTISLVVGGIFLAALLNSGNDKGIWLLVDENSPQLDGIVYQPVKSTKRSKLPLIWAHSDSFVTLKTITKSNEIWDSFSNASEKVLHSSTASSERDRVQLRRNKVRLAQIWSVADGSNPVKNQYMEGKPEASSINSISIKQIADILNQKAKTHLIGGLQEIRTEIKNLARRPSKYIFSAQTISDEWAFHHGGRTELQFNIGLETESGIQELRHGVAFSFETSKTLPSIEVIVPKVRLFNDFLRLYPELYSDMRMWHYIDKRSSDYMPGPINSDLVTKGCFLFVGKRQPVNNIDYELILDDFDRLLPLYKYIESNNALQPVALPVSTPFTFKAGCSMKISSTIATYVNKQLNVNLRHNELQQALYQRLVLIYGEENVGTELTSGVGTSIDIIVRMGDKGYYFYEIKTALSPRACLREAIGQLLEYAFWPGAQQAIKLVVVGESPIDEDCNEYLRRLNLRFPLPIDYEQIIL